MKGDGRPGIAVFGLGEAGSRIAADIAAKGVDVAGYDPAAIPTPHGVTRHESPIDAVKGVRLVMAITAATDAQTAIAQAWNHIQRGTIYADLSTAPPTLKEDLNDTATLRGLRFADVADGDRSGTGAGDTLVCVWPRCERLRIVYQRLGRECRSRG